MQPARMSESPTKPPILAKAGEADVLSVFEVNSRARSLLERHAADVWVEGEIRDFTRAGQGHLYFCLLYTSPSPRD